jgi:hypothetical protein
VWGLIAIAIKIDFRFCFVIQFNFSNHAAEEETTSSSWKLYHLLVTNNIQIVQGQGYDSSSIPEYDSAE